MGRALVVRSLSHMWLSLALFGMLLGTSCGSSAAPVAPPVLPAPAPVPEDAAEPAVDVERCQPWRCLDAVSTTAQLERAISIDCDRAAWQGAEQWIPGGAPEVVVTVTHDDSSSDEGIRMESRETFLHVCGLHDGRVACFGQLHVGTYSSAGGRIVEDTVRTAPDGEGRVTVSASRPDGPLADHAGRYPVTDLACLEVPATSQPHPGR